MTRIHRIRIWLANLIAPRPRIDLSHFGVKADWLYFRARGTGYEVGIFADWPWSRRPIQMTECEFGLLCAAGQDLIDRVRKVQEGGQG